MKYAYIRVSTAEQHNERQFEAMKNLGIDKYFEEKVSAKDTNRPELQKMLGEVREGDVIYIKDFSRLARSTKDLLDIVERLKKKRVDLISLKENLDSSTSTGKLMLTMIAAIYEFERENLLERQREGIKIAKDKGVYKGRKKIDYPKDWDKYYKMWKSREITGAAAMQILKLKRNTFYKLVKEYGEDKK
jgi:DNA invertase Pin-like site-specific DNA recombinase